MRRGRTSHTADFIALSRALGHLHPEVSGFDDPVSVRLLSPESAASVERAGRGQPQRPYHFSLPRGVVIFNQLRTVVLDRAIVEAAPVEQLVILGAGLDGRAHRLAQLHDTTVFEVDHPDTQVVKRERAAALTSVAREIRYVAVDFTRDRLDECLARAGFNAAQPAFWLWEGVTMYLTAEDVARTMSQLSALSTPGSRLALTYFARTRSLARRLTLTWIGMMTGEPYRSAFGVADLNVLAQTAGWETRANTGLADWMRDLAPRMVLSSSEVGIQQHERIWIGRRV